MKKIFFILFVTIILIIILNIDSMAADITNNCEIFLDNNLINTKILDNDESTFETIEKDYTIKINSNEQISGIYIIYELESKKGNLTANNKTIKIGENNFLHEYIDIEKNIGNANELTLVYEDSVRIADIYVLGIGEIPEFVEIWEKPCERADLMLVSAHGDDEHLYFCGLLPTYVARGAYVQVVYFTQHLNDTIRFHEQLHGLYAVGIRNYPIFGIVPDKNSKNLSDAISNLEKDNLTEKQVLRISGRINKEV